MKIQRPTGTLDFLPEDNKKIEYIVNTFKEICETYNYQCYSTPTFEYTGLFKRGIGDTTDIVNKEMFTFIPRENQKEKDSITLKPEGTAPIVRSFIQNNIGEKKPPAKMYYYTPCFRNERNQKGRFKEFHQLGIEVLGSDKPRIDAEVITLVCRFFEKLGILENITLNINSVGTVESRQKYNETLKDFLKDKIENMCDDCKDRYEKNTMRIIDCKEHTCQQQLKDAPTILDSLDEESKNHFEQVKSFLDSIGVKYTINPKIVRGLDYYTKTAFEFVSEDIGSQSTVCGGGRYDKLVEQLGGKDVPGIGFAVGVERLMIMMDELNKFPDFTTSLDLYIAPLGEKAALESFKIADSLRKKGIVCDIDYMDKSLKAQMKYANEKNAKYVLIIGDNELETKKAMLKNMTESSQEEVDLLNIESIIIDKLN